MISRTSVLLGAIALAFTASAAFAQQKPVPPMPADIKVERVSAIGLNTPDIERSMKFYTEVLGFKVATRLPATGEAREYLLSLSGERMGETLVVLTARKPEAGATSFGRLVLAVPNARKVHERILAAGYPSGRDVKDGTNIVKDPDGYIIELYQRAAPAAAAPAAK